MSCQLDHIVIAAQTLEAGAAWIADRLGVTVPDGGKHPLMGTHNRLMRLGDSAFLEIIAIDPDAPAPERPRWYSLDDPRTQERIAERPGLLTWVVRTDDIDRLAMASLIAPGPIEQARRGDLAWEITIPRDGSMPEGGLFPTLIQWPDSLGANGPVPNMPDLGCRLERLRLRHPDPGRLSVALASIGADRLARVERADADNPPGLAAVIDTANGAVELC